MFKNFKESLSPEYSNLVPATDSKEMSLRFSADMPKIMGRDVLLTGINIPRVFPKPGGEFLIQYELKAKNLIGHAEKTIFLYGYLSGKSRTLPDLKNIDNANKMTFKDLSLVIPVFPADPGLPQLPGFFDNVFIIKCLNNIEGLEIDFDKPVDWDILSYRVESRCVIRYSGEGNLVTDNGRIKSSYIAKIYRPRRLASAYKIMQYLESNLFSQTNGNMISIPRVLLVDSKLGFMLLTEAPGKSLHLLTRELTFQKGCAAAGELLRKLHSANPDIMSEYTAVDELADLEKKLLITFNVFPALRGSGQKLLNKLKGVREKYLTSEPRVFVHRDFYDKQIMYSNEQVTLLDCDNAVSADPALDYGNFLAHLVLRSLQYPEYSTNIHNGETAFVESYNNLSDDFKLRAEWWKAATLLRLIFLYAFRPRWQNLIDELLRRANSISGI